MKMREVKFRAWDKQIKKMIFPSVLEQFNEGITCIKSGSYNVIDDRYIHDNDFELMQFTGLKDKKGKEIYEGDIVQIQHPCWVENCEILFDNGGFYAQQLKKHPKNNDKVIVWLHSLKFETWDVEIIDNIYENPELKGE